MGTIAAVKATAFAHAVLDDAPAIRIVDALHDRAIAARASDVHIEPSAPGGRIRQRVDGTLQEVDVLPQALYLQVVSRIKLLAGMDIADRRAAQDGRYSVARPGGEVDARVNSIPTIAGEKIVVRFLQCQARLPRLEALGMPDDILQPYVAAVRAAHGFILVCGPTGSGKTTTLYASLAERNHAHDNLCSVEDPVEVRVPGVAQVQVNERAGVTFAAALRAFLRQDPNVVMIGEMRDAETARVAFSAALAGQLVLTTLHCQDAAHAVERLCELGVDRNAVAASISVIVAQRLVRVLCAGCRSYDRVSHAYEAQGCDACQGSGYRGRTGLFEAAFVEDGGCALAGFDGRASGGPTASAALRSFARHGAQLVADGITTAFEVRRVAGAGALA